jgi:hypothetical protein
MAPHTRQENRLLRAIGRSLLDRLSDDAPEQYSRRIDELMNALELKNLVLAHPAAGSPARNVKSRGH